MAQKLGIRNSLLAHGAMRALVEPLKSRDTVILVNVTLCVSLLACDLDARAEVGICSFALGIFWTEIPILLNQMLNSTTFSLVWYVI